MQCLAAPAPRPATCSKEHASQRSQRATCVARQQQAAAPRKQLTQQAPSSSAWQQQRRQRQRWAVAAPLRAVAPSGVPQESFDANNKDYAVVTQEIEDVSAELIEGLQGTSLFLIGMMGSGKSTVGKLISQALGYCFFDTDTLIEQASGKKVSEIFAEEGEASFREVETQVLAELAPFKNCVIATGGGAPTKSENWGHMQGGISVWLNGPPTLLAHRVVGDGTETRPLLAQSEEASSEQPDAYHAAVDRLTALLEQRRELYQIADLTVSLEGSGPDAELGAPAMVVCSRVLAAINQRIKVDAAERKERMNFEIVQGEMPEKMRMMQSPVAQQEEEGEPFLP